MIALTTFGNAALRGTDADAVAAFYPSNSSFQFCEFVRFVDVSAGKDEIDWAADPLAWFERLKREGTKALRLHFGDSGPREVGGQSVPSRMLAGFVGGGGRWLLEAIHSRGSDYWEARWEVGDRTRTDRKIWRIKYGRIAREQPTYEAAGDSLETLRHDLDRALTEIERYARSQPYLEHFAEIFELSRAELSAAQADSKAYHADLAPPGYLSPPARQLLAAAQEAWVFGGMGSWNDYGPDDDEYHRVSQRLFVLLNQTYVAVANAAAPPTSS
jgi:hypothetical protein